MTKFTLLMAASLLALAPQMAQGSANNNEMPGLESESKGTPGSVPPKIQAQEEDDLDKELAREKERAQKLAEEEKAQEAKRKELEALKAENAKKEQELTVGQKVGRETDRVFDQVGTQFQRFGKHLKKGKF